MRKSFSLDHKVLAWIVGVSSIGPMFSLFSHDFVVDPGASELSIYISLGLVVFLLLIFLCLYIFGVFQPFSESSLFPRGLKEFGLLLGIPVLFFSFFG